MDNRDNEWHFTDMSPVSPLAAAVIPVWSLYGESRVFPDVLHIERFTDRAAGLDWQIAPHRHQHLHQFFLFQSGAARVSLDGENTALAFPCILNVPPGVVHQISMAAGTEGWVLSIPCQTLPDLLEPTLSRDTALGWGGVLPVSDDILSIFQRIADEHRLARPAREIFLRALAAELACLVLRLLGQSAASVAGIDPRLQQFQALLTLHLRDRWTLAAYARALGVSERHLSRICQKSLGQPASAVIEAACMREASRLLAYTRAPISQIGYGLGFEDPSYFSRVFRRVMGLSPAQYRAGYDR